MISDVKKNKQMSEIKIEPEELCDSNFTQNKETESTCSTFTSKFYIKSKTLIFVNNFNFLLTGNKVSDLGNINNTYIKLTELKTDKLLFEGRNLNCNDKDFIGNCLMFQHN